MADETFAGPIDFLVFGFPPGAAVGEGLRALLERVDQEIVEILDLEVIQIDQQGRALRAGMDSLGEQGIDLSVFEGAESGILDKEDLVAIAAESQPGSLAIAVVYEDRSLAAAGAAWARAGGKELLSGGVDLEDLAAALEDGE